MEMSSEHPHQLLYLKEIAPKPIEQEAGWTPGLTYFLLLEKLTGSAASQEIPRIFGT